jgi:hypothetical protein
MSKYNFNIYITSDILRCRMNAESQVDQMALLYEFSDL